MRCVLVLVPKRVPKKDFLPLLAGESSLLFFFKGCVPTFVPLHEQLENHFKVFRLLNFFSEV